MYNAYLEIYQFAISLPKEQESFLFPKEITKNNMVPLAERINKRFFWVYSTIYFFIFTLTFWSIFLLVRKGFTFDFLEGEVSPLVFIIGYVVFLMLFGILYGWIIFWTVRRYHKRNKTTVYRYGKLSYNDVYPSQLRKDLLWINAILYFYFTFAVVPIITRIQHMVETKLPVTGVKKNHKRSKQGNARLQHYNLIKNFIESRIADYGKTKIDPLTILKTLFERRISEIKTDVQRISIILSSLGIVLSLLALLVKDPIQKLLQKTNIIEVIVIFSLVISIIGVIVYLISQLQIQIGKGRDLSIVLDTIDVMLSEYKEDLPT